MGDLQAGKCAETTDGIVPGSLLCCDLLAGHPGQHHDPFNGADWSAGLRDNGTVERVEYAITCGSGKIHEFARSRVRWQVNSSLRFALRRAWISDHSGSCGPHRVVQRTVSPWTPVPVDPKDSSE